MAVNLRFTQTTKDQNADLWAIHRPPIKIENLKIYTDHQRPSKTYILIQTTKGNDKKEIYADHQWENQLFEIYTDQQSENQTFEIYTDHQMKKSFSIFIQATNDQTQLLR